MRYEFTLVERCDMCGSREFKLLGMRLNGSQGLRPKRASGIAVSVKQCRDCGLIFADPQPKPDDIADHYGLPPEDYWINVPEWSPSYLKQEIETAKRLLPFRPGMTALDIGAGLGNGMRSLTEAGYDAWGIEPSKPFRDLAISKIDPARLTLTTLEEAEFPAESFDFITFGAVLEHLFSPSAALDKAMTWLKPGGILQIEVPHASYLISKMLNLYFRLRGTNYVTYISPMHPPFHLYEFTLRSFRHYEVAEHRFDVCNTPYFRGVLRTAVEWIMARTNTEMQLTLYLRR